MLRAVTEALGLEADVRESREESSQARLRIVAATLADDPEMTEFLKVALEQSVAMLGGIGGAVHVTDTQNRQLCLITTVGLPPAAARRLDLLSLDGDAPEAVAVRDGTPVWSSPGADLHADSADEPDGMATPRPEESPRVVVPFAAREGPSGAISVLLGAPRRLEADERRFMTTLAEQFVAAVENPPDQSWSTSSADWVQPLGRLKSEMKDARVGSWDWNLKTGERNIDDRLRSVYGLSAMPRRTTIDDFYARVHPEDLPKLESAVERAKQAIGVFAVEIRIRRDDGTYRWVETRGRVLADEHGEASRVIGTAVDTTEERSAKDAVARMVRHMTDGFISVDPSWHVTYANIKAEQVLGYPLAELVGRSLWNTVLGRDGGSREAAFANPPGGHDFRAPTDERWYHERFVPVPGGTAIYLTDISEARSREAERAEAELGAARRAARIHELTASLAEALTVEDVVSAVAHKVLPPFEAAGVLVETVETDHLRVAGAFGFDDRLLRRLDGVRLTTKRPSADVVRSREPLFVAGSDEFLTLYPNLRSEGYPREFGAAAFLPLTASGRSIGCFVIAFRREGSLDEEERTLLTAVSGLLAQALERARLYDAEHERAHELQRGLLPRELPETPAASAVARYVPAGERSEVGGDWYDVIPLSGDQVALVIGDVMGHGLAQAVTMARLRTAVQTLADLGLPPNDLLAQLNDNFSLLGESFATFLYISYDPSTRMAVFGSAGHPPPAIVEPDGTTRFLALPVNPPLGVATPPFDTVELEVPEGSLLILYTDGLVESRTRDIDTGIAALGNAITDGVAGLDGPEDPAAMERLSDSVMATLRPEVGSDDDAALLIARARSLVPEQFALWRLSRKPTAAREAREHAREQLHAWQLGEMAEVTELLVSELVTNALTHAEGQIRLRLIRSSNLICEVSDGTATTPRVRRALETDEGGRGLALVSSLATRWGTRYTAQGKTLWVEQVLPHEDTLAA